MSLEPFALFMILQKPSRFPRSKSSAVIRSAHFKQVRGFTLVEVMVGMFVFTLVAIGITATVMQTRRIAQLNVMRTVAYTVAQGYIEQILSLNAADIEAASEFWVTGRPPLPTESVNAMLTNTTNVEISDPLYVSPLSSAPVGSNMVARTDVSGDMWNVKNIMIDLQNNALGVPTAIPMTLYLDVNISRNWQQVNGVWQQPTSPYMLIKVDFQYQSQGYLTAGWYKGSLQMVRTDIAGQ